jgi:hypothetical protein
MMSGNSKEGRLVFRGKTTIFWHNSDRKWRGEP